MVLSKSAPNWEMFRFLTTITTIMASRHCASSLRGTGLVLRCRKLPDTALDVGRALTCAWHPTNRSHSQAGEYTCDQWQQQYRPLPPHPRRQPFRHLSQPLEEAMASSSPTRSPHTSCPTSKSSPPSTPGRNSNHSASNTIHTLIWLFLYGETFFTRQSSTKATSHGKERRAQNTVARFMAQGASSGPRRAQVALDWATGRARC